jgi:hypothetical protein
MGYTYKLIYVECIVMCIIDKNDTVNFLFIELSVNVLRQIYIFCEEIR